MRIALLTGLFPVPSETPFLNQVTGLIERGHEVDIYADQSQLDVPPHSDIGRLQLLARTRYPVRFSVSRSRRWGEAIRLIRAHRGRERAALLHAMNPLLFWRRAFSLDQLRRTAPFLPRRHYDVCYCPYAQDARKSLRLRRLGVLEGKLAVALRGSDISRYLVLRGEKVYRRLFRAGDLFLPVCQAFARRIINLGCPQGKIIVHPTGITLSRFPYRPRQARTDGALRLITIGRLVEKKGIRYALRAVRELIDKGCSVTYEIVGEGPLRRQLEADVEQLNLGARVRFAGWQTQGEVQHALECADLLLAPCVTAEDGDEEGIPNVLREGMAVGVPVIATWHSGIPELIQDGVSGFLVPERDSGALAERIQLLAATPGLWAPMLKAARQRVEQDDIDRLNDRFIDLLEELLTGSARDHSLVRAAAPA